MLSMELINLLLSTAGSAWLTMHAQSKADLAEERKFNAANYEKRIAATEAARNADAKWKGFYWIRGSIAIIAAVYFFIAPLLAIFLTACFDVPIQIVIGYTDVFGLPIWGLNQDMVFWIKLGSASPDASVLVYDPVKNNIMMSIIGMYFGNQIARRG